MENRAHPLSRRAFLGASAAAAAPFVLGERPLRAAPRDPDPLRVGLVGCGGRGTGAALQALLVEGAPAELAAVADVFPDRIDGCLAALGAALGEERADRIQVDPERRFAGFDAFERLAASDVDVVLLAAPPHFRPRHLAAAVAAGKHVFCEKPVAVDAPGVRSVLETVELARESRLSIASGFCWRYNVRNRELYGRVLDGAIGDIRSIYATYNTSTLAQRPRQPEWSDMEWQLRNWQHFVWLSGDHLVEQAVHSVDKIAWAMGDEPPLSVTAVGGRQARTGAESGDVYDHFGVTWDWPRGVKAFLMARQIDNCSNSNSDWLWGSKGTATVHGWTPEYVIEGESAWRHEGPGNDMYQQELDELFASIRSGQPLNDGVWMARSTMLAIMARMAAYTGQTITWEQALASEERLGPEEYAFGELPVAPVAVPGVTQFS